MQSSSSTKHFAVVILLIVFASIVIMEATANPAPEQQVNVADALRYLQDIENKHAQFARPRPYEGNDGVSVNVLIRYLEDLEDLDRKHRRTPRYGKRDPSSRFGKRGNEFLNKEYTNNFLRFMLENPEFFQQQQES